MRSLGCRFIGAVTTPVALERLLDGHNNRTRRAARLGAHRRPRCRKALMQATRALHVASIPPHVAQQCPTLGWACVVPIPSSRLSLRPV